MRTLLTQLLTLTQSTIVDATALEPVSTVLSQVQRLLGATTVLFYLRDEMFNQILPRIKRRLSFAAPREMVFDALTQAEHLARKMRPAAVAR